MTREQFEMKESNWKIKEKELNDTIFALKVNRNELKEEIKKESIKNIKKFLERMGGNKWTEVKEEDRKEMTRKK